MTVINKSSVTVDIYGISLKPNQAKEYPDMTFNTLNIHSDIGSCVITTEYGRRNIRNYGNLSARETDSIKSNSSKDITIYSD